MPFCNLVKPQVRFSLDLAAKSSLGTKMQFLSCIQVLVKWLQSCNICYENGREQLRQKLLLGYGITKLDLQTLLGQTTEEQDAIKNKFQETVCQYIDDTG